MKKYALSVLTVIVVMCLFGCAQGENPPADADSALTVHIEEIDVANTEGNSYHRFVKDQAGVELVIAPSTTVYSFKFVSVNVEDTGSGLQYNVGEELYSLEELSPGKPFAVKMQFAGLFPTYGIFFCDKDGNERFYTVEMNGLDEKEGNQYYLHEITEQ